MDENVNGIDYGDIKPKMSIVEAEKLLETVYGFKGGPIKQLEGFDDLNFHCLPKVSSNEFTTNGLWPHGYVLKVMNSFDSKNDALCEGQNEIMLFLRKNGVPSPVPVKTVDGRFYVKKLLPSSPLAEDTQKEHIVRLLEFQPGIVLKHTKKSYSLMFQLGIFIAKLNEVLKKFSHPVYESSCSIWHLKSVPELKHSMDVVKEAKRRELVEEIIEKFTNEILTRLETFEKGMIHGDLNENNILMGKSESGDWNVSTILDFGDSHESCYIFELAIALCYMMLECRRQNLDILVGAGHLLAGYLTIRPNFTFEYGLLKLCICARLCQSVVLGLKAYSLQPGNIYVLESQELGWPVLEEFWSTPEEKLVEKWESVFRSYNIKKKS